MRFYWKSRRWLGAVAALLSAWCTALVAAQSVPPETADRTSTRAPLTTVQAIRTLAPEQAARAYPVHFVATVAFYDPLMSSDTATLFVHDATGGIFLATPARPGLPIHEGDLVEVSGVTGPGRFAPVVIQVKMRVVGRRQMPSVAPLVNLSQLMTGSFDSQWVQFEGVVHAVRPQGENMLLKIATESGTTIATTMREPDADYTRLIGARVRVFGIVGSRFNARRQLVGVHLFLSTLRYVKVLRYGLDHPFALPTRSVHGFSEFEPGKAMADREHLRGVVTLQRKGELLCIDDTTGGLCMDTIETQEAPIGSMVDVVGFRAVDEGGPKLTDAMYRRVPSPSQPAPSIAIEARDALRGGHSGELVELKGEIVGLDADPREPSVLIDSGGLVFPVDLPRGVAIADLPTWQRGSRVRVRGICTPIASRLTTDERQGMASYAGFRLLLRSASDLTIVQRPSWWTPFRAIRTLSVALVTTLAALVWALMLHRRVRLQTGMLQESQRRFRHLAYHDPLTGLANRSLLQLRLSGAMEKALKEQQCLALLLLDLDGFKQVNDELGHDAGDTVLRTVAERLLRIVREPGTVARMGGDEFVVLLPGMRNVHDACACAERILRSLAIPMQIGAQAASVSCSVGISTFDPDVDNLEGFLKKADAAMYQAKLGGRNQFRVCEGDRFSSAFVREYRDGEALGDGMLNAALG